jgi:hypothetical protein
MTVSGLEDEFSIGAERGIARFMYVHADDFKLSESTELFARAPRGTS